MSLMLLYLLLLKATMTSFSGLAPLPMVRADLVVNHKVLTDHQLNTAVATGRIGPGPIGLWIVSVGYFVGGVPGRARQLLR
jgi:chromate transporter